jgi:hypothetical protein
MSRLADAVGGLALFEAEAVGLRALLDPDLPAPAQELERFRSGESPLTPAAAEGLRTRESVAEDSAAAYVLLRPGQRGVRLLHLGVGLLDVAELVRIKQAQRAQGRVETLLAILALAPPQGLAETSAFREAYGFEFVAELHRGVFDVLLHRARAALEDAGSLERGAGTLALRAERPLLIPDPRVSQRTADRVLRLLAERGRASAKDAAGALGVSLRTAQGALAELSDSGACEVEKDGRNVAYVVEDTVFSEPSQRLSASDLTGLTRGNVLT